MNIWVIVTAHDEAARISATLAGLSCAFPGAPVVLADDGSSDETATLARSAGACVVSSGRRTGKGAAATLAAEHALAAARAEPGGEEAIFVLCDGDVGRSAARLGALADAVAAGQGDVAVARFARRIGGGLGVAVAFARFSIARRCGFRATAPISGQRALCASALADVLPFAHGFGIEIGMTIDAVRAGHRVVEIELDLSHRATMRTPAGFVHRARQLLDFVRADRARRYAAARVSCGPWRG